MIGGASSASRRVDLGEETTQRAHHTHVELRRRGSGRLPAAALGTLLWQRGRSRGALVREPNEHPAAAPRSRIPRRRSRGIDTPAARWRPQLGGAIVRHAVRPGKSSRTRAAEQPKAGAHQPPAPSSTPASGRVEDTSLRPRQAHQPQALSSTCRSLFVTLCACVRRTATSSMPPYRCRR